MNTYVELKGDDRKFDTIGDAIEEAERQQLDTADIYVYSEDGELLEWQIAERNPYSGDLVYSTWGVFKAAFHEDGSLSGTDILAEMINNRKEAIETALKLMDYGVFIQDYSQTLSENIGDSRNEAMYIHLATKNVWLSSSPDSVEDADDAEYICTLNTPDTLEDMVNDLAEYVGSEASAYDDCWNSGEYEDQYCPLCPHNSECGGYEDRD